MSRRLTVFEQIGKVMDIFNFDARTKFSVEDGKRQLPTGNEGGISFPPSYRLSPFSAISARSITTRCPGCSKVWRY